MGTESLPLGATLPSSLRVLAAAEVHRDRATTLNRLRPPPALLDTKQGGGGLPSTLVGFTPRMVMSWGF